MSNVLIDAFSDIDASSDGESVTDKVMASLSDVQGSVNEEYELVLDSYIDSADMAKIPVAWKIGGDLEVNVGLFIEGSVAGKVISRGNAVVVDRGAEILGGVTCEILICCGRIKGDIRAEQIILGDDGVIEANEIVVGRGKFMACPGSEFTGKIHSV